MSETTTTPATDWLSWGIWDGKGEIADGMASWEITSGKRRGQIVGAPYVVKRMRAEVQSRWTWAHLSKDERAAVLAEIEDPKALRQRNGEVVASLTRWATERALAAYLNRADAMLEARAK